MSARLERDRRPWGRPSVGPRVDDTRPSYTVHDPTYLYPTVEVLCDADPGTMNVPGCHYKITENFSFLSLLENPTSLLPIITGVYTGFH